MSFLGLEIAKRALLAHRQAMDTAGHNVANVHTPGYSRQRVNLATTPPSTAVVGRAGLAPVGTGVEVVNLTRLRDAFLDDQFRDQVQGLGDWETRDQVLAEVEQIFGEPSDTSLRSVMDEFWVAWRTLANQPENLAAREAVVQRALALVETFRHVDRKLWELQDNLNANVGTKVDEINVLAREIAGVNARIAALSGAGAQPNDLLDQRDHLVDQLARLVDVDVLPAASGMVRVLVNGVAIVDGVTAYRLVAEPDPGNNGFYKLRWEGFGLSARVDGGELAAYLNLRDTALATYRTQVADLAWALATQVNALHAAGYDLDGNPVAGTDWENFFVDSALAGGLPPTYDLPPTRASFVLQQLAVNPRIGENPRRIAAASYPGSPGDGSNAGAIAGLKFQPLADLNNFTPDDYYRGVIGSLGSQAAEARRMAGAQKALTDRIDYQRQAVSGVNLDEEMADLLKFQHAFQAAAQVVNLMNDLLDTVINRMGLVGR